MVSDPLHLLKRVRYRMVNGKWPLVVGLDASSTRLKLLDLMSLVGECLPHVVFSNDPITKVHDSLPMMLFRFEVLLRVLDARLMEWFAYLFPWTLFNEAISKKEVDYWERVTWLRVSYCYMTADVRTLDDCRLGSGVTQFGNEKHPQGVRCLSTGRS
jgi:hypothetical protein